MHQRPGRALEIRLVQIGIILAELVGEETCPCRSRSGNDKRDRVIAGQGPLVAALIDRLRDRLAQDVQAGARKSSSVLVAPLRPNEHLPCRRARVGLTVSPSEELSVGTFAPARAASGRLP